MFRVSLDCHAYYRNRNSQTRNFGDYLLTPLQLNENGTNILCQYFTSFVLSSIKFSKGDHVYLVS